MGADGGITITKISDIKTKWSQIRESLINWFESDLKTADKWEIEFIVDNLNNSKALPLDISGLSNEGICDLFGYLRSCDCPYLYEDSIITANGDYVPESMCNLSMALNGIRIETWT